MEQKAEIQTEITPESIINITKGLFVNLPADFEPKPAYLKPWVKYLKQNAPSMRLNKDQVYQALIEISIARVFSQCLSVDFANETLKPRLKDFSKLRSKEYSYLTIAGIDASRPDLSRLVKYLILQVIFPTGINLNNERITFNLNDELMKKLLSVINDFIPGMKNLTSDQFVKILTNLGFNYNPDSGSYLKAVNQQQFQEMLTQIIHTHSL